MLTIIAMGMAVASQFNLVCEGESTSGPNVPSGAHVVPTYSKFPHIDIIRVDLKAMRYCWDKCTETFTIHKVEPTLITFESFKFKDPYTREYSKKVNRETGDYHFYVLLPKTFLSIHEKCERAEFTGFPAIKF